MINALIARAVIGQPEPEVGMGATFLLHSDRRPATIVRISYDRGRRLIDVQNDNYVAKKPDAADVDDDWQFERNPTGTISIYRREASGVWSPVAFNKTTRRYNKVSGPGLRIGERDYYYDPSF